MALKHSLQSQLLVHWIHVLVLVGWLFVRVVFALAKTQRNEDRTQSLALDF
jgi:hypothetical protein